MGSTELTAHTRLPLRNDRKAESRHKDAFIQQHVTHFDCRRRLTHDYGDDRGLSRQWLEPRVADSLAEIGRILAELVDEPRVVLELPDRTQSTRRHRGRQRIGKELWTRTLREHVA